MDEQEIIDKAKEILQLRLKQPNAYFSGSQEVKDFLTLKYGELEHESFNVMFLDTRHGLIELKEMFRGTVNASPVYHREILKTAMEFNAAALVLSHNHPSQNCEPSYSDIKITDGLKRLLKVVDVEVLDHIIVGGTQTYSFAEHGHM